MVFDDLHIKFKESQDFLTSYYRDELNAKGLDDYKVRLMEIMISEIRHIIIWKVQ